MILVTLGSREYQFNRLLEKIDQLIIDQKIEEQVFAQIGQSDYIPKNFEYKRFLSKEEFSEKQHQANIIITHGGTGAMVSALKMNKKVIAVPRLAKYGEHIDDHQLQVASILSKNNFLITVTNLNELEESVKKMKDSFEIKKFESPNKIIPIIQEFLVKG